MSQLEDTPYCRFTLRSRWVLVSLSRAQGREDRIKLPNKARRLANREPSESLFRRYTRLTTLNPEFPANRIIDLRSLRKKPFGPVTLEKCIALRRLFVRRFEGMTGKY
jgi:hypothetical protein